MLTVRLFWMLVAALFLAGCSEQREPAPALPVQKPSPFHHESPEASLPQAKQAKAALLQLMRSDPSVFPSIDRGHYADLDLMPFGRRRFQWGMIRIDLNRKSYSASTRSGDDVTMYFGDFDVDEQGQWTAHSPSVQQGRRPKGMQEAYGKTPLRAEPVAP
jgi:hypothetical protein